MIKRINISVFQPSKIAFFLKDKMGYVFLYMALLAFLASLPIMIRQYVVTPLSPESRQNITGVFIQKTPDCTITGGELTCNSNADFSIDSLNIRFLQAPKPYEVQIIFETNQITLYSDQLVLKSVSYVDLGITDLNLALTDEADVVLFKTALEKFALEFQSIYATMVSIGVFVTNFILYMSIAGIMAMSFGFRLEKLIYRYRFIMAAYSTTSYFVLALVAELYGLGFILLFGMILPFITMTIAFNGLLSLSKVVIQKKDDEE